MYAAPDLCPALNLDVLLNVMSFSDKLTISRMMRASRDLYSGGPRFLLQDDVVLRREESVLSFVAFMRAEHPHRHHYLTGLEISTGLLSEAEADGLEKFLIECESHLQIRKLFIDRAEEFFESSSGLTGAFALLRHIKHLKVTEIGKRTNVFLMFLRSHLETANLSMIPLPFDDDRSLASDEEDREDDDQDYGNPILQLRNSQQTLRSLSVSHCDSYSEERDNVYDEVYPNLTELTLHANEIPATACYVRAFPNVRILTLECDPREFEEVGTAFNDFYVLRVLNKVQTAQQGKWSALHAVRGTLIDHFLLGLMCPVEWMYISGAYMDKRMLRSVLGATRPKYLNFQGFDVDLFYGGEFTRLMRWHFTNSVRSFEITLFFGGMIPPAHADVPKALDALIAGLSKMLSLRSFGLTFCCSGLYRGLEELLENVDLSRPPMKLYLAEEYLRDLDLGALACRIRDAVPTLETVAVSLIGLRARANASAAVGEDVHYEEGAVERMPLAHAAQITKFVPPKSGESNLRILRGMQPLRL